MRIAEPRFWRVIGLAPVLLAALSELVQWLGSRESPPPPGPTPCAVIVLGAPSNDDGSPSRLQRLRVDAGIGAAIEHHCGVIVFSGGAAHNAFAEADAMAELATARLAPLGIRIERERQSTNTWENIRYSLPLTTGHSPVFLASEGLHARRGRRYLCRQQPSACAATFLAPTGRPWWMLPYRLLGTLHELRAWVRDSLNEQWK